jgi:hypothetical protein
MLNAMPCATHPSGMSDGHAKWGGRQRHGFGDFSKTVEWTRLLGPRVKVSLRRATLLDRAKNVQQRRPQPRAHVLLAGRQVNGVKLALAHANCARAARAGLSQVPDLHEG